MQKSFRVSLFLCRTIQTHFRLLQFKRFYLQSFLSHPFLTEPIQVLHLLYILAFTIIAFLAVSNLIRSLITVSMGTQRSYYPQGNGNYRNGMLGQKSYHPELFDENGDRINEPLLVMRSVNVEDARQQLDALYNASPSVSRQEQEEDI